MSDRLSDIYSIPIVFVDGQNPTADFFNSWADQIEVAFSMLEGIIGDVYGASSYRTAPSYLTNLNRTLANIGWINDRLPPGLTRPDNTLPALIETLTNFEGEREALLTFHPTSITASTLGLGNRVAAGDPNPSANITTALH